MDLDELDNALFGNSVSQKPKSAPLSINNLFGDSSKTRTEPRKTISFADQTTTSVPSKNKLDDLFGSSSTTSVPEPKPSAPRPSRLNRNQSSASSLLDNVPTPSVSETTTSIQSSIANSEQLRIQRLEAEIERLNQELDTARRKQKAIETEVEDEWKNKMIKKDREHATELETMKNNYTKQITKVESEREEELSRMKNMYEKQLDEFQSTVNQTRDFVAVIDKVDTISSTINRLSTDISATSERSFLEREMALNLRQQQLESKELRFEEEKEKFQEDKKKTFELNASLSEMCKNMETQMDAEKWRLRDEQNRLIAEKKIFKDDQKYIMTAIEQQTAALEKSKSSFLKEQHDLLIRVCSERTDLDQEKNSFYSKRTLDIRRLKEEAMELQTRLEYVEIAEKQAEELKKHYDNKLSQLQELEVVLMEECIEMENIRNQLKIVASEQISLEQKQKDSGHKSVSSPNDSGTPRRVESVRSVMKKHAEFLSKYTGQKVAAVAPNSSGQDF